MTLVLLGKESKMRLKHIILALLLIANFNTFAVLSETVPDDSLCGHLAIYDTEGKLLSWYKPEVPGAGYFHVAKLASEFVRDVGTDDSTGLKLYFISCCFQGPHTFEPDWHIPSSGMVVDNWMHNPACIFAGMVHSLADHYYSFTGDETFIGIVQEMLDYQLENGTTPDDFLWANVPYASSDPWDIKYEGAKNWENDKMRGDGVHGIEPDKVGELGFGYLVFYKITMDKKYLNAAINCANALAEHVKDVRPDPGPFIGTQTNKSPWPFRVNAKTGKEISEYTSNVLEPVKLFNELLKIKDSIDLTSDQIETFTKARDIAWEWLYSRNGPIKTFVWNGYFEDIQNDEDQTNRIQVTPMEVAKYIMEYPELDPDHKLTVKTLLHWVKSTFQDGLYPGIREQTWCFPTMGSHTSRYGSTCAMWYDLTGDEKYKEEAFRHLNYASYMTYTNGVVAVGHKWPGSWWSDGYGDYIRHFFDAIGAVPEWAPADEDHMVKSTSVIKKIRYQKSVISYQTFDSASVETFRLTSKPKSIKCGGKKLSEVECCSKEGWTWKKLDQGGILKIKHEKGQKISIKK